MRERLVTVGQVCRECRECANGAATGAATGFRRPGCPARCGPGVPMVRAEASGVQAAHPARAARCELTQSCPMPPGRPRLPWPMRARCRSTPGTRWILSCHLAGAYSTAYPCRRRGLRRARDPLRERLVPHVRVSLARRPVSGARGLLDGENLCAQMGLSVQTSRSNPRYSRPAASSSISRPWPRRARPARAAGASYRPARRSAARPHPSATRTRSAAAARTSPPLSAEQGVHEERS